MQNKTFLSFVVAATMGISGSWADKITLSNGDVLKGKVLEETDTEYILEVFITSTIKDRKTFKKSEVESIEAEAPDKKPFEELADILPTPDRLPAEEYKALIDLKVRPFVDRFPKSKHIGEVKRMLATLEEEYERVESGAVKLKGEWIAPEDWNANAYELDAQIEVEKVRLAAQRNNYRGALLAYETLEKAFPHSEALAEAKDIVRAILPVYSDQISRLAENAKAKQIERDKGIEAMPLRDAQRVRKVLAEKQARYEMALADARKNRSKWLPVDEYDERGLKSVERAIASFTSGLDRQSRRDKNLSEAYREAWELAATGDVRGTERLISRLKSGRMDEKYLNLITAHLEANPAPEPIEKEEEEEEEASPEPAADAETDPEKPTKKPKPRTEDDLSEDNFVEEEEESSLGSILYLTIGIALIGILVGIILKSRKSKAEA